MEKSKKAFFCVLEAFSDMHKISLNNKNDTQIDHLNHGGDQYYGKHSDVTEAGCRRQTV